MRRAALRIVENGPWRRTCRNVDAHGGRTCSDPLCHVHLWVRLRKEVHAPGCVKSPRPSESATRWADQRVLRDCVKHDRVSVPHSERSGAGIAGSNLVPRTRKLSKRKCRLAVQIVERAFTLRSGQRMFSKRIRGIFWSGAAVQLRASRAPRASSGRWHAPRRCPSLRRGPCFRSRTSSYRSDHASRCCSASTRAG